MKKAQAGSDAVRKQPVKPRLSAEKLPDAIPVMPSYDQIFDPRGPAQQRWRDRAAAVARRSEEERKADLTDLLRRFRSVL